jgi:hypothetical protein
MEVAESMDLIKNGKQHTLPEEFEQIGAEIAEGRVARARYTELELFNDEAALQADPEIAKWIQFAQIAALQADLGSYRYILEDRPELPKVPVPHAGDGKEVLEGIYSEGCTSLRDARTSGRAGIQVSVAMREFQEEQESKSQEGQESKFPGRADVITGNGQS